MKMKQKKFITAILAILLLAVPIVVLGIISQANKIKCLEVSFDYQRQGGPGSNQYAVWIENEKGDVVKTLFVTSYTTKGRARGGEQPKREAKQRGNEYHSHNLAHVSRSFRYLLSVSP